MAKYLALSAFLLISLSGWAQNGDPGTGDPSVGPPGPTTNPTTVPLDGGAALLLASGIGYGVRRLRQRKAAK